MLNGTCVCQDSQYTPDESGKCVYVFGSINQPTVIPVLPNDTTGVNSDGSQTNSSVTPTNVAAQTNPNIDASQQTDTPTCGVVGKKECNSNYYVCASDSDCTSDKLPANATAGHCWKGDGRSVCTATDCKTGYTVSQGHCVTSQVTNRNTDSQKSNTQTAQRPNNTNQKKSNTTNNSNLSKQDMSKNGTFAKAYGTDGKCSVYQNKSWADKSTSWCDDLYKGEWKVQFDYGLVRGKTACDTDGGVEKRLGTPAGKAGQYCWCKVTQYTPNGGAAKNLSLSWMYNKGDSSKGSCEYHCALWCASDIRTDPSIRQKMFNAK